MKELKFSMKSFIAAFVITAVFFVLGIVLLVLPDDVYFYFGDSMPEVGRYVWFVACEFFALVTLIRTTVTMRKQKSICAEYNALREKCGENAFFIAGYSRAIDSNNSDAIKTTVSVLGAAASTALFGIGVYKFFRQDPIRLFLLFDEGIYVIRTQSREKLLLKKGAFKTAELRENGKEQLELICPDENFVLTFDTLKNDIKNDELAQKLQLLFFNNNKDGKES